MENQATLAKTLWRLDEAAAQIGKSPAYILNLGAEGGVKLSAVVPAGYGVYSVDPCSLVVYGPADRLSKQLAGGAP